MADTSFYFDGESAKSGIRVDTSSIPDLFGLKQVISNHLGVVQPEGWSREREISFQAASLTRYLTGLTFHHGDSDEELTDLDAVKSYNSAVKMKVNGHAVRDVPGPQGLPLVGNWFEGMSVQRPVLQYL